MRQAARLGVAHAQLQNHEAGAAEKLGQELLDTTQPRRLSPFRGARFQRQVKESAQVLDRAADMATEVDDTD